MAGSRSCSRGGERSGAGCRGRTTWLVAMLAQAGYLFPWIWVPLVVVLVRGWRRLARRSPWVPNGSGSAWPTVPLAAFTAVACFRPVLPHWGLIGLVSLFPMLGRAWAARLEDAARPAAPPARRLCRPVADADRPDDRRVPDRLVPARPGRAGRIARRPERPDRSTSMAGTRWPAGSASSGWSTTRGASCSRDTGIRAPRSPTPWGATGRSCVTTPTIRADSPSGAVPRIGSAATASWSWWATSPR